MTLYQLQRENTKKEILNTAIAIFKENGYDKTTINQITSEIGIAKGTFYNFYTSKNEILISWAINKFQGISVYKAFSKDKTIEGNLSDLIDILVDTMKEEELLFQYFLREIFQTHWDETYRQEFDFLKLYRYIIENSCDAFKVNQCNNDLNVEVLNNSLYMGLINWYHSGNSSQGMALHLKRIVQICLHGLMNI